MENLILSPISLADFETLIKNCVSSALQAQTPAPPPQEEEYLTVAQVCNLLSVSKVTLCKWRTEGKIPFRRIGTRVRFLKSEVLYSLKTPKKYGRKSNEPKEEVK